MKDRDHNEAMAELFKQDPDFAVAYLNDVLENGDATELRVALRQIAKAEGLSQSLEAFMTCLEMAFSRSGAQNNHGVFSKFSVQKLNNALKHLNFHLFIQPLPSPGLLAPLQAQ